MRPLRIQVKSVLELGIYSANPHWIGTYLEGYNNRERWSSETAGSIDFQQTLAAAVTGRERLPVAAALSIRSIDSAA